MQVLLQPLSSSAVPLWGCDRDVCELVLLVVLDVTLILVWTRWVWVWFWVGFLEVFFGVFKEEILGCQMQAA